MQDFASPATSETFPLTVQSPEIDCAYCALVAPETIWVAGAEKMFVAFETTEEPSTNREKSPAVFVPP